MNRLAAVSTRLSSGLNTVASRSRFPNAQRAVYFGLAQQGGRLYRQRWRNGTKAHGTW